VTPEQSPIQEVFAPLSASFPGAAALRDDAALYATADGNELVLTMDSLVAGVHFLPQDLPDLIARKALRVNLSDLAAKGATPTAYLLSIALSASEHGDWIRAFAQGLALDQRQFGCVLIGGDTVSTPGPLSITITAIGEVPRGEILRRGGARAGDLLYVSGTIGDAALGLRVLRKGDGGIPGADSLRQRYWLPEPRVELAPVLRRHASAAMDVSDGLIGDLTLMCEVSRLTARIDAARVPLSGPARAMVEQSPDLLETCLTGGDDYEILCTVPEDKAKGFEEDCRATGIAISRIGRMEPGEGAPLCLDADGHAMTFMRTSYSHLG